MSGGGDGGPSTCTQVFIYKNEFDNLFNIYNRLLLHNQISSKGNYAAFVNSLKDSQCENYYFDNTSPINLWDINNKERVCSFFGHNNVITDLEFNHKETVLASAGIDGFFIWNIEQEKMIKKIEDLDVIIKKIIFSEDDSMLVAIGDNSIIYLIDAEEWKIITTLIEGKDKEYVTLLADGDYSCSQGTELIEFLDKNGNIINDSAKKPKHNKQQIINALKTYTKPVISIFPQKGKDNEDYVWIRQKPDLMGKRLGKLMKGQVVTITAKSSDRMLIGNMYNYWYKIETQAGIVGWSYGHFIDILNP